MRFILDGEGDVLRLLLKKRFANFVYECTPQLQKGYGLSSRVWGDGNAHTPLRFVSDILVVI